jgi:hypothetical protein
MVAPNGAAATRGRVEMRNLRQRFGAFVLAGVLAAAMFGTTSPAYAGALSADGTIGGSGKNACAFVEGLLMKIPEGVPGTTVAVGLGKLALLWACAV